MTKVLVTEQYLSDIADAIREKKGVETTYKPGEMAAAIGTIHGDPVLETLTATQNNTYTPSTGKDGFSEVTVNVPNSYSAGDEGKVVSNGALVAQSAMASEITINGTYDTTLNDEVTVNVSGGGGEPSLPSEYQEVEYVKCTDYQYININKSLDGAMIMIDMSVDAITSSESGFMGLHYNGAAYAEMYTKNGNISVYQTNPSLDNALITNIIADTKYRVNYVFLNTVYSSFKVGVYRTDRYPFAGKIYRVEYANNTAGSYPSNEDRMVLKPCYRKSDGVIGMYDVLNNVFYTNSGTGSFGKGSDV